LDFYIAESTVPYDTNLNVEVLRRVLLKIQDKGGIHDTVYIQTDNAGGWCNVCSMPL
jgi:hypothetical protein